MLCRLTMVAVLPATLIGSGGGVGPTRTSVPRGDDATRDTVATSSSDSGGCRLRVVGQRRLRMPDGSIPYVASFSEAWRDDAGLFMGGPVFLFDSTAGFSEEPVPRDSLIGLLIDTSGIARPVATPLTGGYSLYPRVVNATEGGWDVIIARSPASDSAATTAESPAELWFGHFDGRRWSAVDLVAVTRGASLRPEYSSRLVRNHLGDLAFAYPFLFGAPTPGIVLVRRSAGRWRSDSLPTPERVDYVGVEPSRSGNGWTLAYRMPNLSRGSFSLATLWTVTVDSTWKAPGVVVHGKYTRLTDPVFVRVGDTLLSSWWQRPEEAMAPSGPIGTVRWAYVDTAAAMYAPQTRIAARVGTEFQLVSLGHRIALWVLRDLTTTSRVSLSAWHEGVITELGALELTNDTGMSVVARDDSTVSLLSSRFGRGPGDPPVTSTLTTATLSCMQ